MTKGYFSSEPLSDQEKLIYHDGFPIGHPKFDLEDSFSSRLNQIRAIAGLFFVRLSEEGRLLNESECNGISNILNECAYELGVICHHMLENQEGTDAN